jgi:hypothetical protein
VLQNSNIGTWPADSRTMFKDEDPIKIDDDGNLVGYVALTEPTEVKFLVAEKGAGDGVYDLKTGKDISAEGKSKVLNSRQVSGGYLAHAFSPRHCAVSCQVLSRT